MGRAADGQAGFGKLLKDARAIAQLDFAARAGRHVLEIGLASARAPGRTPCEIEALLAGAIRHAGGEPVPRDVFPMCASIAVNADAAHALPTGRPFEAGDIVTIDVPMRFQGWWTDQAGTVRVGDQTCPLALAAAAVMSAMVAKMQPGVLWSAVAAAARDEADRLGVTLIRELAGHGIGRSLHEPPVGWLDGGPDFTLRPGLCLTIEPVVTTGSGALELAADGWTLRTIDGTPAVGVERMVAVGRTGARLLGEGARQAE